MRSDRFHQRDCRTEPARVARRKAARPDVGPVWHRPVVLDHQHQPLGCPGFRHFPPAQVSISTICFARTLRLLISPDRHSSEDLSLPLGHSLGDSEESEVLIRRILDPICPASCLRFSVGQVALGNRPLLDLVVLAIPGLHDFETTDFRTKTRF